MHRRGYLLTILCLFLLTAYQHFSIQKVKRNADSMMAEMRSENRELKIQVSKSEGEIQNLIVEKEAIERDLVEVKGKLMAIEETLDRAQTQLASLGRGNKTILEKISALLESKQILEARVRFLTTEKDALERRMNDLRELKLAIKELKRNQVEQKMVLLRKKDQALLALGNRGFLIKDGEPTLQARGRVNVIPAPTPSVAKTSQENF